MKPPSDVTFLSEILDLAASPSAKLKKGNTNLCLVSFPLWLGFLSVSFLLHYPRPKVSRVFGAEFLHTGLKPGNRFWTTPVESSCDTTLTS